MRTQKNKVDVSDRVLAATFDQNPGNITAEPAASLEQLCAENPERIQKINHYAKRIYELVPLIPSFFAATIACIIGITAVKFEDGYLGLSGKDKLSRIFASPFFVQDILMPDGSSRFQWKIRTMVPGAHAQHQEMVDQGIVCPLGVKPIESREAYDQGIPGPEYKKDHRITPAGRFLRKRSLDEAPQVYQLVGEYVTRKGWRYSPEKNLYLFGNRLQSREVFEHTLQKYHQVIIEGPFGLVGLDCIGRGKPDHGTEADNARDYSNKFRNHFILPTDLRIGKGLIRAILSGSNS
jgi:lipopolysaccharide/colanic/teichoic acid biosynthesis glycosyltransferase